MGVTKTSIGRNRRVQKFWRRWTESRKWMKSQRQKSEALEMRSHVSQGLLNAGIQEM
jgi:hypothetical protein